MHCHHNLNTSNISRSKFNMTYAVQCYLDDTGIKNLLSICYQTSSIFVNYSKLFYLLVNFIQIFIFMIANKNG